MILVTGATGHLGGETVKFLLKKGIPANKVVTLARNQEKAKDLKKQGVQVRMGDYDDYNSLVDAFRGVEKLMLVSGNELDKRIQQHKNVVDAARAASVKHIAYTSSFRNKDRKDSPVSFIINAHIDTEQYIKESGMDYTFMRNTLYAEYLPMFLGEKVMETGVYLPAGNGKVSFATRTDMAEAAAKVLAGEDYRNQALNFVNSRNYTFYDIAGILGEISGKQISYTIPDDQDYKETLSKAGMDDESISFVLGWIKGIRQGYFESEHSDLELLLERKPTDLKEVLNKVYSK